MGRLCIGAANAVAGSSDSRIMLDEIERGIGAPYPVGYTKATRAIVLTGPPKQAEQRDACQQRDAMTNEPAHLDVLMSGGFSAAYERLLPDFKRSGGINVTTGSGASQGAGPQTIAAQLA